MMKEFNPENLNNQESNEFKPEQELVRLLRLSDSLAVNHVEKLVNEGLPYHRIIRRYEEMEQSLAEYKNRKQALFSTEIQHKLEVNDRKLFKAAGHPERVEDWYAFNDEIISKLEKIFIDDGFDLKDPLSVERLEQQLDEVFEAMATVNEAESVGIALEPHPDRVEWDGQDEAVEKCLNKVIASNPAASISAMEWKRLRQNGFHPYEAKNKIIDKVIPQYLEEEYSGAISKEEQIRIINEINLLIHRGQAFRVIYSDCQHLVKTNKLVQVVIDALDKLEPEERNDYKKVGQVSRETIEKEYSLLESSGQVDKQITSDRDYLLNTIDILTKEQ